MRTKGTFKEGFDSRRNTTFKFKLKICGKRHPHCKICNPTVSIRVGEINAKSGVHAGKNNPNWRGGELKTTNVGWNYARRVVWDRDKVCRLCKLPPYPERKLDVHHIVPRRKGGTNDVTNLVGLHHDCHIKVEFNGAEFSN